MEIFVILSILLILYAQKGGLESSSAYNPSAASKEQKQHQLRKLQKAAANRQEAERKRRKEDKLKNELKLEQAREAGRAEAEKAIKESFSSSSTEGDSRALNRNGFGFEGTQSKRSGQGAGENGKKGVFQPAGAVIPGLGVENQDASEWKPAEAMSGSSSGVANNTTTRLNRPF